MDLVKEIRDLESKGIFIHLGHEHYKDGSNCIWAIEGIDAETKKRKFHTGWYGDNHEFGDTVDCYEAAIRFAKWFLEGDNAEWYFANPTETVTKEGHDKWLKIMEYRERASKIVYKK